MKKWLLVCLIASFVGAALFYWPYNSWIPQLGIECPLCPYVMTTGIGRFTRFARMFPLGVILNVAILLPLGLISAKIARKLKRPSAIPRTYGRT